MKKRSGFTLIELLVVVFIIGTLAALVIVNVSNARKSARDAKRVANIKSIQTALEMYNEKNGEYPQIAWASNCISNPTGSQNNVANMTAGLGKYLVTDTGLLPSMPSDPKPIDNPASGYWCGDVNYDYGTPDWWDTVGGVPIANPHQYRLEFSLETDYSSSTSLESFASYGIEDATGRYRYALRGPTK